MTTLHQRFRHAALVLSILLGIPVAYIFAPAIEGVLFPVVTVEWITVERVSTPAGPAIEVRGVITKHRGSCRTTDLYAMGGSAQRMLTMTLGDSGGTPPGILHSRPVGRQEIGPWIITPAPPPGHPLTIHVQHECGLPWPTHTTLFHREQL